MLPHYIFQSIEVDYCSGARTVVAQSTHQQRGSANIVCCWREVSGLFAVGIGVLLLKRPWDFRYPASYGAHAGAAGGLGRVSAGLCSGSSIDLSERGKRRVSDRCVCTHARHMSALLFNCV